MDLQEYNQKLRDYMGSTEFIALNPQQQQEGIAGARNWYLEQNPNADVEQIDRITEGENKANLRALGNGRALPIIDIALPNQDPKFNNLSKEEKLKKVEEYKLKVPEIAATAPTQKEDAEYFINQSVRQLERQINGEDTGYMADKGKRLLEGFAAGLADGVGAESAAQGIQDFFHENTKYDEDFTAQLAQGLGSAGSSVLIIAGAAAISGGLGATPAAAAAIGTGASLASNGIMRYNEGYRNAIDRGANENEAHDLGVAAMPAAVIDALSDKIMASKLMPKAVNKVFSEGSEAAKRQMFSEIIKDVNLRGKMVNWAQASITEGLSESVGDYAAAYGPYLQSGDATHLPKDSESLNSFMIGALIGGGISSIGDVPSLIGNKTGIPTTTVDADGNEVVTPNKYSTTTERDVVDTQKMVGSLKDPSHSEQVFTLLSEGKYRQARQAADAFLKMTVEEDTAPEMEEDSDPDASYKPPTPPAAETPGTPPTTPPADPNAPPADPNAPPATPGAAAAPAVTPTPTPNGPAAPAAAAAIINVNEQESQKSKLDAIAGFALPAELKRSAPRYGTSELEFESDFDRAAYILAGDTKKGASKSAGKFMAALTSLGLTQEQVVAHGLKVRSSIKNSTPTVSGERIVTNVTAVPFAATAVKQKTPTAQAANKGAENALDAARRAMGHAPPPAPIVTPAGAAATPAVDPNSISESILTPVEETEPPTVSETATPTPAVTTTPAATPAQAVQQEVNEELDTQGIPAPVTPTPTQKEKLSTPPTEFFNAFRPFVPASKLKAFNQMLLDIKAKNPNVRFTFKREDNYPLEAAGLYDGNRNVIYLSKMDYRTLAHEVAHSLTQWDIKKYVGRPDPKSGVTYRDHIKAVMKDPATPEHIKVLIDVYLKSAAQLGQSYNIGRVVDIRNMPANFSYQGYAFTSLDEFVAEAMSMESFQNDLSRVMYDGKTLWEHFVDALRNSMDWIRGLSNEELTLRSDGTNALVATLGAARQIVESDVRKGRQKSNINYLPVNLETSQRTSIEDFNFDYIGANENGMQALGPGIYFSEMVDGNKSIYRDVYKGRGDRIIEGHIDDGNIIDIFSRPSDEMRSKMDSVAQEIGFKDSEDMYENTKGVSNLRHGRGGFIGQVVKNVGNKKTIELMLKHGIDGISEELPSGAREFSIFNKDAFTTAEEVNINYLPEQTRTQQQTNGFRRLADIKQGNITDKIDTPTQRIIGLLKDIRHSDIFRLPDELQDYFFELVNNIYESRKSAVQNPQIRVNSDEMITRILAIKDAINADRIAKLINDNDDLIDFEALGIDLTNRDAVEKAVNDYMEKDQVADLARNQNRSEQAKARTQQIYQKFRAQIVEMQKQAKTLFKDAENYVKEIEALYGQKLDDFPSLRQFLKQHHDYMVSVDPSTLSGKLLYQHSFALQNILDGNFRGMDITAAHLGKARDVQQDIKKYMQAFRDPVVDKSFMLRTLDTINKMAELHQVQLQRLSANSQAVKFIQEQLLGPLYDGIIRVSNNMKLKYTDEYIKFRDEVLEGREATAEDKQACSIAGRLCQFQEGEDQDAALLRNIRKEYESVTNMINGATTENARKQYRTQILPLLDSMTKGLTEYGEGSMVHFMDTLAERMRGTQDIKTGEQRKKLLGKTQEIFSRFNLASRILSEGFLGKTFKQQVHYIPNDVRSTDMNSGKPWDITDSFEAMDEQPHKSGITREEFHYKERQTSLGDKNYYSYNNETTLKRNVERLAVDHATLPERFVIKSRLKKGSELHKIITQTESGQTHQNRVDNINVLIKEVLKNATSAGAPVHGFTEVLNTAVGMYARPVLSGIHHIVSQPAAAAVDYGIRTGDFAGWFQAALYYAANYDKVNQWFRENMRWVADRSALESQALDSRRTPQDNPSFKDNPYFKKMSTIYEKFGEVITTSMRVGDNFSSKVTVIAEYNRMRKEKGYQFQDIADADFDVTEGNILTQATLNAEKMVNTSNKILRGDFFSDRTMTTTIIRNLLFAFSAHSGSLATQLNLAVRDLIELRSLGVADSEVQSKIRTIGAIIAQQVTFTTARFAVAAIAGKLIISLAQELFDDDEGKIEELETKVQIARAKKNKIKIAEAEAELANAKTVRAMITKFDNNTSTESWFKQVIRDASGSAHLSINNQAAQKVLFWIPDTFMGAIAREGQKKVEAQLNAEIQEAREKKQFKKVAKLTEQATIIGASEYIPLSYSNTQGFGMPGIYGSVMDSYYRVGTEAQGAFLGTKEWNYTDFVSAVAAAGLGQAEVSKALNLIDKIEDETSKRNEALVNETIPKIKEDAKKPKKGGEFNFSGFR